MLPTIRRASCLTCVALLAWASAAGAQSPDGAGDRIRFWSPQAQTLLKELAARSATARELIERLNQSDLAISIKITRLPENLMFGRTGFAKSSPSVRCLVVEVSATRTRTEQLVTLAHELQHAVEIAGAPDVVGPRSLAAHYGRLGSGTNTGGEWSFATFETAAAKRVGVQVRREILLAAH